MSYELIDIAQRVYNVKNYGALGDGSTDDSGAIQSTINAAFAAGGGIVYFPNGVYIIGNSLVTSLDGINPDCQLYIPLHTESGLTTAPTITFLGESIPTYNTISGLISFPNSDRGVILKSTISGSTDYSAVIGTSYASGTWGTFNYVQVHIENIVIRVKSKSGSTNIAPTMGGVYAEKLETFSCNNLKIETESNLFDSATPVASVAGLRTPKLNNNAFTNLKNLFVQGMKIGMSVNEHVVGDNVNIWCCSAALSLEASYHSFHFGSLLTAWCVDNMIVGGTTTGRIENWRSEIYTDAGKWYKNKNDIRVNAGSDSVIGAYIARVQAGVGLANSGFSKTGTVGSNIKIYDLAGSAITPVAGTP